jgi:hypothetical protein
MATMATQSAAPKILDLFVIWTFLDWFVPNLIEFFITCSCRLPVRPRTSSAKLLWLHVRAKCSSSVCDALRAMQIELTAKENARRIAFEYKLSIVGSIAPGK